jgi:hypothetical protein
MTPTAATPIWRRLWHTRLRDAIRGRIDGSLDWRQLVATTNLPPEMVNMIGQVVRRTRLWRSEKVDVARELIAHFQDGLSTGRLPQQLLLPFGDARVAAQLIRRAKKRNRPWPWHVWRWSCWSCLALFSVYVLMAGYLLLGQPSVTTDYLKSVNARAFAAPRAERAWPLYREALLEMGAQSTAQDPEAPFTQAGNVRPDSENWPAAEQFLSRHAAAVAKLRQAGQRASLGLQVGTTAESFAPEDRVFLPDQMQKRSQPSGNSVADVGHSMLIAAILPQLTLLNQASSLLATDCRRAARAMDAESAFDDVQAQLGMCRHVQETSFLVSALIAGSIQTTACTTVSDVLLEHPDLWSKEQLLDLAHSFSRTHVGWRRALEGERAMFYDIVQRVYTDDGEGDGRLTQAGMRLLNAVPQVVFGGTEHPKAEGQASDSLLMALLPAANFMVASRREMADLYDQFLDQSAKLIDAPIWDGEGSGASRLMEPLENSQLRALRYVLVSLFAPATSAAARKAAFCRAAQDGVLIGIALELYRREHGDWPESLAALTPRWLPEVPVDRITGDVLHYKIDAGAPLVYSVGIDLDDDGGRLPFDSLKAETAGRLFDEFRFPNTRRADDPANDGDWIIWTTRPMKFRSVGGTQPPSD